MDDEETTVRRDDLPPDAPDENDATLRRSVPQLDANWKF